MIVLKASKTNFKTIFIVNPYAAYGRLGRDWTKIQPIIHSRMRPLDVVFTQSKGDGSRLVQESLKKRYELVVAVGGDGTISECMNGFILEGGVVQKEAILGVLPYGRGSDFARYFGISRNPRQALEHLMGNEYREIDIGRIQCQGNGGKKISRYFMNIANVGIVAHIVDACKKAPKILGARGSYVYGSIHAGVRYQSSDITYESDRKKGSLTIFNLIVANGRYFGSGMDVSPKSRVDDGLFDIQIIKKISALRFFRYFPEMMRGEHLRHPEIQTFRSKTISLSSNDMENMALVEADGDTFGRLPATFDMLPKAIKFKTLSN